MKRSFQIFKTTFHGNLLHQVRVFFKIKYDIVGMRLKDGLSHHFASFEFI